MLEADERITLDSIRTVVAELEALDEESLRVVAKRFGWSVATARALRDAMRPLPSFVFEPTLPKLPEPEPYRWPVTIGRPPPYTLLNRNFDKNVKNRFDDSEARIRHDEREPWEIWALDFSFGMHR